MMQGWRWLVWAVGVCGGVGVVLQHVVRVGGAKEWWRAEKIGGGGAASLSWGWRAWCGLGQVWMQLCFMPVVCDVVRVYVVPCVGAR